MARKPVLMKCELEVPSKTFVGEYAVLRGGPALIALTRPCFRFSAEKSEVEQKSKFHPDSAASKWFRQSEVLLRDWKVDLADSHKGQGGFGASGAEFVFYHLLSTYLQSKCINDDPADVWQDFKACDKSGGSGADVVAKRWAALPTFVRRRLKRSLTIGHLTKPIFVLFEPVKSSSRILIFRGFRMAIGRN